MMRRMTRRNWRIWRLLPFHNRLRIRNGIYVLLLFLFFILLLSYCTDDNSNGGNNPILSLKLINWTAIDHTHKQTCRFHICFDINRCEFSLDDVIHVHVGDWYKFHSTPQMLGSVTPEVSTEYAELMESVKGSRYYVSDPDKACIFVPSLDTLSQGRVEHNTMSTLLNSLPEWDTGENFLLFNMLPGNPPHLNVTPDYYYGKSMLASAGFTPGTYRLGFDVSIPVYNPMTKNVQLYKMASTSNRPRLLTIITHGDFADIDYLESYVSQNKEDILLLRTLCPTIPRHKLPQNRCGGNSKYGHPFPEILLSSKFCLLVAGGDRTGMLDFTDVMMTGCIPVLINDDVILPFSEVLDWSLASITCLSCDIGGVVDTLTKIPNAMLLEWRKQVLYFYQRYFISMAVIAMTTLDVLNERVFPTSVKSYEITHTARGLDFLRPPKNEGFTTVILTYNRIASLYEVIRSVAKAPSCVKIMVIWNNVDVAPPPHHEWPDIKQPIEVIRSKENKLSNRFYPYDNLTSAVFSLDDDISMLTVDELEFGYQAKPLANAII